MNQSSLRDQMAEVIRTAHATIGDETRAAELWGCAMELCDVVERESDGCAQRVSICVALREDIRTGARSTRDLAEEIVWFVSAVEHDIDDTDRDAIVDDVVCGDQIDG